MKNNTKTRLWIHFSFSLFSWLCFWVPFIFYNGSNMQMHEPWILGIPYTWNWVLANALRRPKRKENAKIRMKNVPNIKIQRTNKRQIHDTRSEQWSNISLENDESENLKITARPICVGAKKKKERSMGEKWVFSLLATSKEMCNVRTSVKHFLHSSKLTTFLNEERLWNEKGAIKPWD